MRREDSSEVSGEDFQVERSPRSEGTHVPAEKVIRGSAPLTVKGHLDVDAVLDRSIRKVAGNKST